MKQNYFGFLVIASLLFVQTTFAQQKASTTDSLKTWLTFLASDDMRGRDNGTAEIEKAAQWIAKKYETYGLKPIAGLQGFFQPYTLQDDSSFVHKNVVGYIPAKKKKNNTGAYIVVSAHFDGIGVSPYAVNGDSIYNGADDNASGTVALLAIAKNLHEHNIKPEIPIVFAAFSNEETGLIGSSTFCQSGVVPLQNMKLNINLEMLGHSEEFGRSTFYITGPGYSNFQDIVIDFNKTKGWEIAKVGSIANSYFFMSDNYSFVECAYNAAMCVPAHTILTSKNSGGHLHELSDEVQYIDFEGYSYMVAHLTQLLLHVTKNDVEIQCNKK